MLQPGRTYQSDEYRFGFQGMEQDDELKGEGNSYTTEFRQYDPRLGRWTSTDPIIHPWESTYVGFGNNPIIFTDPSGTSIFSDIGDFLFGSESTPLEPGQSGIFGGGNSSSTQSAGIPTVEIGPITSEWDYSSLAVAGSVAMPIGGELLTGGGTLAGAGTVAAGAGVATGVAGGLIGVTALNYYIALTPDPDFPYTATISLVGHVGDLAFSAPAVEIESILLPNFVLAHHIPTLVMPYARPQDVPISAAPPAPESSGEIFYHYTDAAGLAGILQSQAILPNARGKVYVTKSLLGPATAESTLFIGNPLYKGRGDYVVTFYVDPGQRAGIYPSMTNIHEYIYFGGRLNIFGKILYAGPNLIPD